MKNNQSMIQAVRSGDRFPDTCLSRFAYSEIVKILKKLGKNVDKS